MAYVKYVYERDIDAQKDLRFVVGIKAEKLTRGIALTAEEERQFAEAMQRLSAVRSNQIVDIVTSIQTSCRPFKAIQNHDPIRRMK